MKYETPKIDIIYFEEDYEDVITGSPKIQNLTDTIAID